MASVASSSSSHYIRTVQTTFTSQWTRSATPEARRPHQPLSSTIASASSARRRAYAARLAASQPPQALPPPASGRAAVFGFEDEPTTPVPTLKSVSPATPRLAHAWLPPYSHHHVSEQSKRFPPGLTARRTADSAEPLNQLVGAAGGNGETWKGFSSTPTSKARDGSENDNLSPSLPPSSISTSPKTTTPELASPIGRRPPVPSYAQVSRPRLTRTPSPPASPAPHPSFSSTRKALQNDRDAKARLVAGIMLNRAQGSKGRRRHIVVPNQQKRSYIQSGLRNEVLVEA
ncbi:hypothetical protein BKA70DRAFT_1285668 [Coprinopsis sp. MPI-PUGE-AT-0042]|nr:hypothetical protein BKA70DRAFT_1285668 [Coprinopsis sp. MPI-PUGE-AT-0042]